MKIHAEVIPHDRQRYETPGDFFEDDDGVIQFRISDLRNGDYNFLVLLHELIEWYLCKRVGIKIKDIDAYDMQFEKDRLLGKYTKDAEPGHSKGAPYRFAHKFAERIERIVATRLGVNWAWYSKRVNDL